MTESVKIGATAAFGVLAQTQAPIPEPTNPTSIYTHTLRGPKVVLIGEIGCGKTFVLRTLLKSYFLPGSTTRYAGAGFKVACIFTEPGFPAIADVPCSGGFHFCYIPTAAPSWDIMLKSVTLLSTMSLKELSNMDGINRSSFQEFYKLIGACANFKCDRCGEAFGPIDKLPVNEWAVAFDSLSGISKMSLNLIVGSKPVRSKSDWGIAMDNIETFNTKIAADIPCTTVLLSHLDREPDENTGGTNMTLSTLGQKLAPKIIKPWDDIIHVKRAVNTYTWSTITPNMTLKSRNLPYKDGLTPSFVDLINNWRAKGGAQLT